MNTLPKPDRFQQAVITMVVAAVLVRQWLSLVVAAVAGSGKTTLLQQICAQIPRDRDVLFLAYNTSIKREAESKLAGFRNVRVKTTHGAGLAACKYRWKNTEVDTKEQKGYEICRDLSYDAIDRGYVVDTPISRADRLLLNAKKPTYLLKKVLNLVRSNLVDETDHQAVLAMLDHFSVDVNDHEWRFIKVALPIAVQRCIQQAPQRVDFNDMIFLPHRLNLSVWQNDIVLVDECQDLSAARLDIALKSVKRNGQITFVGDRAQAIYGFSGADCRSIDTIIETTKAKTLPLSICYRCDKAMVRLAQTIVPTIEWREGADEGTVHKIGDLDIAEHVKPGDLVICRTNAPVIGLAYRLLAEGIPAKIMGQDVGKSLIALVKKVADREGYRWAEFGLHLSGWLTEQIEGIMRRNGGNEEDSAIQRLSDRVECVSMLSEKSEFKSERALIAFIEDIFVDENEEGKSKRFVRCSSVHKAKGLESDRLFVLYMDQLMPHPMARKAWEREQETNLIYVAYTRAKHELFLVHEGETRKPTGTDDAPQGTPEETPETPAAGTETSTTDVESTTTTEGSGAPTGAPMGKTAQDEVDRLVDQLFAA